MRLATHIAVIFLLLASFGLSAADDADLIRCADADSGPAIELAIPPPAASAISAIFAPAATHRPGAPLHCRTVSPLANAIPAKSPDLGLRVEVASRLALPRSETRTGMTQPPLLGPPRT